MSYDTSSQDTYYNLQKERKLLKRLIESLQKNNKVLAKAEHDYRLALSTEILRLHVEGYHGDVNGKKIDTDSVAWTMCDNIARGIDKVAKLRLERDIAAGQKEATMQKIYEVKMHIGFLEDELKAIAKGE
ncbi:hypothetical protein [Halocella sp. SP3-1]|uniref:hypothetical protein n=1 Tax=Halocella sp. SP3-1 TaxID=2382161 RepID=UPI000F75DDD6|nr:hypothetical protein [Halocella sp. SP3-1]AZO96160.1 hypothetical protein D7D81_17040 [Halocella sp. SP3-1]